MPALSISVEPSDLFWSRRPAIDWARWWVTNTEDSVEGDRVPLFHLRFRRRCCGFVSHVHAPYLFLPFKRGRCNKKPFVIYCS